MSTEEVTLSPVGQDRRISQPPWIEVGLSFSCSKQLPKMSILGIQRPGLNPISHVLTLLTFSCLYFLICKIGMVAV